MLLIVEIILTIVAWRKGWKWLSLIPLGIAVIIGFGLGASGNYTMDELGSFVWIDIAAIVALIVMIAKPKQEKIENS